MVYCGECKWFQGACEHADEQCRHPDNWTTHTFENKYHLHIHPPDTYAYACVHGDKKHRPRHLNKNHDCKWFHKGQKASKKEIELICENIMREFNAVKTTVPSGYH